MQKITYKVNKASGEIVWAASEYFGELVGRTYSLGKMEATDIAKLDDLSLTAKLLLSAVTGAIIQRLLDQEVSAEEIFSVGEFTIKKNSQKLGGK